MTSSTTNGGFRPAEAFSLLGNEFRMEILQTLWDGGCVVDGDCLRFSQLYKKAGGTDSGQFNYHLGQLRGRYVDRTAEGYRLTPKGERIIRSVLSGTIHQSPQFGPVEIDGECPFCGGTAELDYDDEQVTVRCLDCEGMVRDETSAGVYLHLDFPPSGVITRDPETVLEAAYAYYDAKITPLIEGICPQCAGTVTGSLQVCGDHDSEGGLCPQCERKYLAWAQYTCDHCSYTQRFPAWFRVLIHPDAIRFYQSQRIDSLSFPYRTVTRDRGAGLSLTEALSDSGLCHVELRLESQNESFSAELGPDVHIRDINHEPTDS